MQLEGQIALVSGGGSGIGRAIARRLAADGARVAVADINLGAAEDTATLIGDAGRTALAVQLDVTDFASVQRGVAHVAGHWGGNVQILVNNAGWDRFEWFTENTPELWQKVIAINLSGPIHCSRAVLDGMIAAGRGKIISIGSDAGRVGGSGEAVYSACKGGIIAFTKALAREVARHRINVNVVCPGPSDTPLLQQITSVPLGKKIIEATVQSTPFRRLVAPAEVAAAVAFFASADAEFITGQVLSVSGGLTMVG
ncbi:MAG: SDR family oxidoreductase [Deltaproteobacteria bacterium]|nr:SDR family oxidoreductase [Deltaproteobacteria bacterium]